VTPAGQVTGFNHVGILTRDFDAVRSLFTATLGVEVEPPELDAKLGLEILWVRIGGVALEFIRAIHPDSDTGRRLAAAGEGVNHIALTVTDVSGALEDARAGGIPTLDSEPRRGVHDSLIGFLDPGAVGGTLVELVQPAARSQA
jgi:methylmalonyl-CoA/ethylmalonyl-CoA epimerase